jgi:hypothetical protein
MENDNLPSVNKLRKNIKAMSMVSFLLKPDMRRQLKDLKKQVDNISNQTAFFNSRFSDYGWCAYDSMNLPLIEAANKAFDENGIEAGEGVLIQYFKEDIKRYKHWIKNSSEAFRIRYNLIQQFFEDHFAERYHSSVPLGLIIIDGAVNV